MERRLTTSPLNTKMYVKKVAHRRLSKVLTPWNTLEAMEAKLQLRQGYSSRPQTHLTCNCAAVTRKVMQNGAGLVRGQSTSTWKMAARICSITYRLCRQQLKGAQAIFQRKGGED